MINVHSVTSQLAADKTTAPLASLVERLASRVDVNRDGNVTSREFSEFLGQLNASLDRESASQADPATAPRAGTASVPVPEAASLAAAAARLRALVAAVEEDR